MAIDWDAIAAAGGIPKGTPRVLGKKVKQRIEDREWLNTKRLVDARDRHVCQVTGKSLTAGAVDPWHRLERHHLEYRSANKARRWTHVNVWTTSAAIHQLIHAGALRVLDKRGNPATDVRKIDHLAWNRNVVAKGFEPCRITKWPVLKD